MALEVIREIVGFGQGLVGRMLMIDAHSMRFETLTYGWDPANALSGDPSHIAGNIERVLETVVPAKAGTR
jgi:hypothetical protein